MDNFNLAFDWILKAEGGYVNHIMDPGGETNMGISKKAYPLIDIKNLTIAAAKSIYMKDYYNSCFCSKMPNNLAVAVFDCAVNQGVSTASKLLQKAVKVNIDGRIGLKTLSAINQDTFLIFMLLRAFKYGSTKNYDVFGNGWQNRLIDLMEYLK